MDGTMSDRNPNNKIVTTPVFTMANEIQWKPLEWLWENRIPSGKVSLLVGKAGKNKSTLAIYMVAQVTSGRPWADIPGIEVQKGNAIILTSEDNWEDTVIPRLKAAEADLTRVIRPDGFRWTVEGSPEKKKEEFFSNLTIYFEQFKQLVEAVGGVRLIVIDPISAYMMGKNENKNAEVREFMLPLQIMAEELDIAIVGINHVNKNTEQAPELRILGSVGMPNAARAVWLVDDDPQDSTRRVMVATKKNLGPNSTGLRFTVESVQLRTDKGEIVSAPRLLFEREPIFLTSDDLLDSNRRSRKSTGRPRKRDDAGEWLRMILGRGPMDSRDIFREGKEEGYSQRTLEGVKADLGILTVPPQRNEYGQFIGPFQWALPDS